MNTRRRSHSNSGVGGGGKGWWEGGRGQSSWEGVGGSLTCRKPQVEELLQRSVDRLSGLLHANWNFRLFSCGQSAEGFCSALVDRSNKLGLRPI